jgi:glycosyltransferase involved in cell wall biosynthesis
MSNRLRILFFSDGSSQDVSTLHRCYMISEELAKYGLHSKVYAGRLTYKLPGQIPLPNVKSYVAVIFGIGGCDILYLHRHGNIFAYLILGLYKLFGRKVIFDYDDAVYLFRYQSRYKVLARLWYSFLPKIIKRSDVAIAGSHLLAQYARNFNTNVYLIPTPVDTAIFRPQSEASRDKQEITIGWMGEANLHVENLRLLAEPLAELSKEHKLRLKLVSGLGVKEVREIFEGIETLNVDYGLDHLVDISEVPGLMSDFDISVMPLIEGGASEGKCAMKALESMAMGIPVVASAVGENNYVIADGVNGFLATSSEEWVKKLEMLVQDETLRKRIGQKGLETIQQKGYTLEECGRKLSQLCLGLVSRGDSPSTA